MSDSLRRFLVSRARAVSVAFILFAVGAGAAQAQIITEFSVLPTSSSQPHGITAGPDGNVWFAEFTGNKIGKITPAGVVTEYGGLSANFLPWAIVTGPDGNLWFTSQGGKGIGRMTTAGVVTEFTAGIATLGTIVGIAVGADGNLWFTEYTAPGKIAKITTGGVITEYPMVNPGAPQGITAGPDGNLWFTVYTNPGIIGRITTSGVITEFSAGITPGGGIEAIAAGADGNLWFTDQNSDLIGKITPAGVVTEYPTPAGHYSQTRGIAGGSDGNVWFTEYNGSRIGRITPAGVITEFTIPNNPRPRSITAGPDGALWFTEEVGNRIARITTGLTPAGAVFYPLTPCRVLDTRNPPGPLGAPALQAAGSADRSFTVIGTCGIPGAALAISANLTVTNTLGSGYLSLYRGDGARTGTYSISFLAGQTRANNAVVQLALDLSGSFKVQNTAPGNVDFILDVNGYFR